MLVHQPCSGWVVLRLEKQHTAGYRAGYTAKSAVFGGTVNTAVVANVLLH
jgi:hypothetical protein